MKATESGSFGHRAGHRARLLRRSAAAGAGLLLSLGASALAAGVAPAASVPAPQQGEPQPKDEPQRQEPQPQDEAGDSLEGGEDQEEPGAEDEDEDEDEDEREDEDHEEDEEPRDGPGTLLGGDDGKIDFGGYGGLTVQGSEIADGWGLLLGGEAGLLLDHRFAIGIGGHGLASRVEGPRFSDGARSVLGFGYGGVALRYQIVGKGPVYVSLGTLVGAGAIALFEEVDDEWEFHESEQSINGFLVIEPSLQVHANLTRWMRLGLDGSYRFVHGVNSYGYQERDIRGFAFGGHLQFGWF
jgi:hypothetical protein